MFTALDSCQELELKGIAYDGCELRAEVRELVVVDGRRMSQGKASFLVIFPSPVAHALTEEFPASYCQWIQSEETGALRRIENTTLRTAMGLDLEQFQNQTAYAPITAHEVLVVYCNGEPMVTELQC